MGKTDPVLKVASSGAEINKSRLKLRSSLPFKHDFEIDDRFKSHLFYIFVLHYLVSVNRILLPCGGIDDADQILLDDCTYLGTNHKISCSVSWQIGSSCNISLPKSHKFSWGFFCPRNLARMSLFLKKKLGLNQFGKIQGKNLNVLTNQYVLNLKGIRGHRPKGTMQK